MLRRTGLLTLSLLTALGARAALADTAADCARLADLKLPDTQLTASIAEGPLDQTPWPAPPAAASAAAPAAPATNALGDLPSFCRVRGIIKPAVRFEVWLPLKDWNGKFQGTGNGGYNGGIVYTALAAGLARHYATANTDMGHLATSPDPGSWALHHPELVIDQGYRAQHETALKAKDIVRAFYGKPAARSYFIGCSSGGWQALTEAHRYPHDYDGLIAGAPASEVVHLHAAQISGFLAASQLSRDKLHLVASAVLARCDAADGVKDGLVSDPEACGFQPAELACKPGQTEGCLTPTEVAALQTLYAGPHYASGAPVYPGWPRGGEDALVQAGAPMVAALTASTYRNMVYEDPQWDLHTINYDRDVKAADARIGAIMNDGSTDLKALRSSGGKVLLWHGWADPLISPLHTIQYYKKLAKAFAPGEGEAAATAKLSDFARLFLAPGVYHCGGGPGPGPGDALMGAMEQWVEHGVAPDTLLAVHQSAGKVDRSRPLCPYPKKAVYDGKGSSDDAASFSCH